MGDSTGGPGPPASNLLNITEVDEDDLPLSVRLGSQNYLRSNNNLVDNNPLRNNVDIQHSNPSQADNQLNNSQSNVDFTNKYLPSDKAPFIVFVEHEEKNIGRLFPVRVGHYLLNCGSSIYDSVVDIKIVGVNRVKVILDKYTAANALVDNQILKRQKLLSYIPKFCTQKKGIVKMVDTYFSEEYLLNSIESKYRVVEVKRLTRKIKDMNTGQDKIVNRQMIAVSFLGNELPQEIRINKVNFPVEPFIHPVIQCRLCLRFGHTDKLCKGKVRCQTCSNIHSEGEVCDGNVLCAHCGSIEHVTLSRKCPAYFKQKSIKEIMAKKNVSFREAEQLFNNPSYSKIVNNNRFSILNNDKNFPELPNNKPTTISPLVSYSSLFHKPRSNPHNSSSVPNKKRKSNYSPERTSKKDSIRNSSSAVNHPVIPNPHRRDFMEYKESIIDKISIFVGNLIQSTFNSPNASQAIENLNIKESLSSYLDTQPSLLHYQAENMEYNDASSEHSSY